MRRFFSRIDNFLMNGIGILGIMMMLGVAIFMMMGTIQKQKKRIDALEGRLTTIETKGESEHETQTTKVSIKQEQPGNT